MSQPHSSDERGPSIPDCILRTVVGSRLHGLALGDTDDRDEMAIYIESPVEALSERRSGTWTHRTQPEGRPGGAGDLDLVVHSLSKYCRLAMRGNLTALLPLFAPPEMVLEVTPEGDALRSGRITLPVPEPTRSHLIAVRQGEVPRGKVQAEIADLALALRGQPRRQSCPPPECGIELWMVQTHLDYWQRHWTPPGLE